MLACTSTEGGASHLLFLVFIVLVDCCNIIHEPRSFHPLLAPLPVSLLVIPILFLVISLLKGVASTLCHASGTLTTHTS